MPFLRIPVTLATALAFHAAITAPNPPLNDTMRTIKKTGFEVILVSHSFREAQKLIFWVATIAETAIILAQLNTRSILAQRVISKLALGGGLPTTHLTPQLAFGSILVVAGAFLRIQCYRALGKHFTFETSIARDHKLVTSGPYRYMRHPSYTGAAIVYLGLLCACSSPGSWFMECLFKGTTAGAVFCMSYAVAMGLVVFGLFFRMSREDEGLRREFGEKWKTWAATVPYVLVPGIY
ncbi:hypothetical protein GGX14DRAFT_700396 [Mycena pura]|uniref:Protein-S-isoprenylcysteine O-methyltransferase n=1 Tax=Mycena pura TaxID=153505 RepID=A0AAD6UXL6_9AGAR|nr:hypothetical protein GGX14DRAFT_700396 [Mycena pura]